MELMKICLNGFSKRRKSVTLFSSVVLYSLVLLASLNRAQAAAPDVQATAYDGAALIEDVNEEYENTEAQVPEMVQTVTMGSAETEVDVKPVTEEKPKPRYALTDEERTLVEKIVSLESSGIDGMGAVAQVILNRIESSRFPNTVSEVIYQKGQFTTVSQLKSVRIRTGAAEAVSRVFDGNETFVKDVPLFFCAQGSSHRNLTYLETVGGNKFYK